MLYSSFGTVVFDDLRSDLSQASYSRFRSIALHRYSVSQEPATRKGESSKAAESRTALLEMGETKPLAFSSLICTTFATRMVRGSGGGLCPSLRLFGALSGALCWVCGFLEMTLSVSSVSARPFSSFWPFIACSFLALSAWSFDNALGESIEQYEPATSDRKIYQVSKRKGTLFELILVS